MNIFTSSVSCKWLVDSHIETKLLTIQSGKVLNASYQMARAISFQCTALWWFQMICLNRHKRVLWYTGFVKETAYRVRNKHGKEVRILVLGMCTGLCSYITNVFFSSMEYKTNLFPKLFPGFLSFSRMNLPTSTDNQKIFWHFRVNWKSLTVLILWLRCSVSV